MSTPVSPWYLPPSSFIPRRSVCFAGSLMELALVDAVWIHGADGGGMAWTTGLRHHTHCCTSRRQHPLDCTHTQRLFAFPSWLCGLFCIFGALFLARSFLAFVDVSSMFQMCQQRVLTDLRPHLLSLQNGTRTSALIHACERGFAQIAVDLILAGADTTHCSKVNCGFRVTDGRCLSSTRPSLLLSVNSHMPIWG